MEIRRFISHLMVEKIEKDTTESDDIVTKQEKTIPLLPLVKHGGNRVDIPSALSYNGKNEYYSFDLTNSCNRGCPGCYVDRAKETGCNAVGDLPLKEYKGDLRKWEHEAKTPEQKAKLKKTKELVNANGGIRMFSAADYPIVKNPDNPNDFYGKILKDYGIEDPQYFKKEVKAFLDDAHKFGWDVKAITKEPKFVADHVDHPAIKGINLSMNSHGFGIPHETVKALKNGKGVEGVSDVNHDDAHKIGKHSDKIIGRTVTYTPWDLKEVVKRKNDDGHIGVITSGHNIPGNGIRYVPSVPQDNSSPKKIIIQTNFPENLMHMLNGDKGTEYTEGDKKHLKKFGHFVESMNEEEVALSDYRTITTLIRDKITGEWKEVNGVYHKDENPDWHKEKNKSVANVVPDLIKTFEEDNRRFEKEDMFTVDDAKYLIQKMSGKMCCAGEKDNLPSGGKCTTCKAKCGVKGCGSNTPAYKDETNLNPEHIAALLNKYAEKYNKVRDKALADLKAGTIQVTNTNVPKQKPLPKEAKKPETYLNYKKFHGEELDKMKDLKGQIKKETAKKKGNDPEKIDALQAQHDEIANKDIAESRKLTSFIKFLTR